MEFQQGQCRWQLKGIAQGSAGENKKTNQFFKKFRVPHNYLRDEETIKNEIR